MPEYRENELCYEDYRALRTLAGWETHSEEQTRRALAAALYDVTAVEDGRAVAMGRLVGTGCTTSSRAWWSRRNTRGAALERLWQKSFWPMPKAGCLRADERTAYCGRRQGGLLHEKLGFRKMPGGGCGFALRRVLHGHPAE